MTVSILVPSSLAREAEDKREATRKIGYVARAATIFRIDRLTVYPDPAGEQKYDDGFVATVLRYAATPPDLRKEVWDTRDELEYAGILPPLRVRSQTGSGSDDSGSLRQGIVTKAGTDGHVRVNCGLQHPISLPVPAGMDLTEGERVTVRVSSREPVRAKIVDVDPSGYVVDRSDLDTAVSRSDAGLAIAASRYGEHLGSRRLQGLADQCRLTPGESDTSETETANAEHEYTVAFGAPERGLPEILGFTPEEIREDGCKETGGFDLWLNTVPNQGSQVVRTEEAVFATLACLNLME
jgi:predicted SPOUT superfamily RNA methylase MTH1